MPYLTCPSKTFLIGEYLALTNGPGLVLTTQPYFKLDIAAGYGQCEGIDKNSPAGRLYERYQVMLTSLDLSFYDPHFGAGGFGASSGQYLLIKLLLTLLDDALLHDIDEQKLLEEYKELAWRGHGLTPSGYDLISQLRGHIACINHADSEKQKFNWPFANLSFCLLRTGQKLATHEHLEGLHTIDQGNLADIAETAIQACYDADDDMFCESIAAYADALHDMELVSGPTQALLQTLNNHDSVLAAKGCGALGADVILVILARDDYGRFNDWLNSQGLILVYHGWSVAHGAQLSFAH